MEKTGSVKSTNTAKAQIRKKIDTDRKSQRNDTTTRDTGDKGSLADTNKKDQVDLKLAEDHAIEGTAAQLTDGHPPGVAEQHRIVADAGETAYQRRLRELERRSGGAPLDPVGQRNNHDDAEKHRNAAEAAAWATLDVLTDGSNDAKEIEEIIARGNELTPEQAEAEQLGEAASSDGSFATEDDVLAFANDSDLRKDLASQKIEPEQASTNVQHALQGLDSKSPPDLYEVSLGGEPATLVSYDDGEKRHLDVWNTQGQVATFERENTSFEGWERDLKQQQTAIEKGVQNNEGLSAPETVSLPENANMDQVGGYYVVTWAEAAKNQTSAAIYDSEWQKLDSATRAWSKFA
jgi:hypothetical protein